MSVNDRLEGLFKDMITQGEDIIPSAPRDSYENWDSLANMNLMMAIMDEFGDVVSLDDMEAFTSYENILNLISKRI